MANGISNPCNGDRLSEIVGEDALDYDREQKRKGMVFGAEKAIESMKQHPEVIEYLKAYKDGVNAYISGLSRADFPVEYKLLDYAPEPWTLKKTALLLMYMTDMLEENLILNTPTLLKSMGKKHSTCYSQISLRSKIQ